MWQGRSALDRGDELAAQGDLAEAIHQWRRAARWYVPLASHVDTALTRLEKIARSAREGGDQTTALAAWRGMRSAVMATRSFYTPNHERLTLANQQIAELMAALEGAAADPTRTEPERVAWHLNLLERPVGPSVVFSLVAIVGFVMWIGGAFWFAWSALNPEGRLVRPIAKRAGLLVIVGLVVWLTGLHFA